MTEKPEAPKLDLDALVERAKVEAAGQRSSAAAQARVVRLLADAGGGLPLEVLLRHGAPKAVIADLVSDPSDRRQKPKVRLGMVGSEPACWLTATGWMSTGRQMRERAPDTEMLAHLQAPTALEAWLEQRRQPLGTAGVRLNLAQGPSCRAWSEQIVAQAWASLKTASDYDGSLGSLTGGLISDCLLTENWGNRPGVEQLYQRCWGIDPTRDDLAETTVAVEFQNAAMSSDPLRHRLAKWDGALDRLGAARAVLWVCSTRQVADRLRELGVDDPVRRPSQWLVPARAIGLPGEDIGALARRWWLLDVPCGQGAG